MRSGGRTGGISSQYVQEKAIRGPVPRTGRIANARENSPYLAPLATLVEGRDGFEFGRNSAVHCVKRGLLIALVGAMPLRHDDPNGFVWAVGLGLRGQARPF